jgi:hypothetical protein
MLHSYSKLLNGFRLHLDVIPVLLEVKIKHHRLFKNGPINFIDIYSISFKHFSVRWIFYGIGTVHRLRDGEAGLLLRKPLLHMPKQLWVSVGIACVLYNSSESRCYTNGGRMLKATCSPTTAASPTPNLWTVPCYEYFHSLCNDSCGAIAFQQQMFLWNNTITFKGGLNIFYTV